MPTFLTTEKLKGPLQSQAIYFLLITAGNICELCERRGLSSMKRLLKQYAFHLGQRFIGAFENHGEKRFRCISDVYVLTTISAVENGR